MAFNNSDNKPNSSSMFGFFNSNSNSRDALAGYRFNADVSGSRLNLYDAVDLQCAKLGCHATSPRNTRGA